MLLTCAEVRLAVLGDGASKVYARTGIYRRELKELRLLNLVNPVNLIILVSLRTLKFQLDQYR